MFGRLAMRFANVRAGTRELMLVLVQVCEDCGKKPTFGLQQAVVQGGAVVQRVAPWASTRILG